MKVKKTRYLIPLLILTIIITFCSFSCSPPSPGDQTIEETAQETAEKITVEEPEEEVKEDVAAFVTRFYSQCLSRDPDSAELNGWVDQLESGAKTGADVAYGFVFSDEFIQRNVSNEEYVTILYRTLFNREPDSGGYSGWLDCLNTGKSRKWVLASFIDSQEFINVCAAYGINPGSINI